MNESEKENRRKEDHMKLQVDYDLSINADHISKCKIDVNIKSNEA